jgi:hypothetical protein
VTFADGQAGDLIEGLVIGDGGFQRGDEPVGEGFGFTRGRGRGRVVAVGEVAADGCCASLVMSAERRS